MRATPDHTGRVELFLALDKNRPAAGSRCGLGPALEKGPI